MCSIIGINGINVKNHLFTMIEVLKHRGPDATGVYSNNKVYLNENVHQTEDSNFMLANNLLSIIGNNELQPLQSNNLTLIANAEIYNYETLIKKYEITSLQTKSDCEIILKLIEKHYDNNLKEAVLNVISELDGDYAFCITDGEDYMVLRDEVGVKPVYYGSTDDYFAFASESKALKQINIENINSLKPTQAIYNNKIISIRKEFIRFEDNTEYSLLKEELKNNIINAVHKRVNRLDEVAVLFSAGVDSTLIAVLLKKFGIKTTLYTVGTENSQDLEFAKKVSEDIQLPLKTWIINEEIIENNFIPTLNIIEDTNLMKLGVGMTINLTSKLANKDGHKVILSGQGADELFTGYNRYKRKYKNKTKLLDELTHDLNNMYHVNLERDDKATMANSIELRVPYMDKQIIKTAIKIPINYMLHSEEDNIRKHILRDIAQELGVPEYIAYRPKKAAQYGTGIEKISTKTIIKKEKYQKILENYH
ncbi:MAG: asparagine synthetase B [Methanosphaera sp.]|nr:asparagine synthetase B [Methanosphaera sp.]